jgi:hypothetical protein
MKWIYERQLISCTFAIDDAFVDRVLMFKNGDRFMTGLCHEYSERHEYSELDFSWKNNEDSILDWLIETTNYILDYIYAVNFVNNNT